MKKFLVTLSIVLCTVAVATAQPRAIGARLGGDIDFSYQHSLGDNMLDLSAGLGLGKGFMSFGVAGAYDWIFPLSGWQYDGDWNFYVGPGLGLHIMTESPVFALSIGGQVGIEYAFEIPLNLSLDYRPMINLLGFGSKT